MSVLVDGFPVEFGETISRTGVMNIRCDGSYVLSLDGTDWSPIGSLDGADEYIIASSGRFSVKHDGREIFFFVVSYDADFQLSTNNLRQFDSARQEIDIVRASTRYAQSTFKDETVKVSMTVAASNLSASDLIALNYETNQSDATITSSVVTQSSGEYVLYEVTGFDKTVPFWLKVGNIMIAFLNPVV